MCFCTGAGGKPKPDLLAVRTISLETVEMNDYWRRSSTVQLALDKLEWGRSDSGGDLALTHGLSDKHADPDTLKETYMSKNKLKRQKQAKGIISLMRRIYNRTFSNGISLCVCVCVCVCVCGYVYVYEYVREC